MTKIIGSDPKEVQELAQATSIATQIEQLFADNNATPTIISQSIKVFTDRHTQRINNLPMKAELEATKDLQYEPIKPQQPAVGQPIK